MENLTERIDRLFAENKGAEAEAVLEQALQEAYEKADWAGAVPILNELIGYCRETSQVERSYSYAKDVQEILHKLGMENTLPYATTLLNIANAYRAGGRLEDSLKKYEQVAQLYGELLEAEDMLWASFYNNLSLLYQEMGRFDLAKESLLKALAIVVKKKDTIFEQAVTYTNLASTCLQLGQGAEAEKYFGGAILLYERNHIIGTHYYAALSSLATYYYQRQEYGRAEEFFTKAMKGIEAQHGKNEFYERMRENVQICRECAEVQRCRQEQRQAEVEEVPAKEPSAIRESRTSVIEEFAAGAETFPKGLELCRAYFEEYGRPMLQEKFGDYQAQIAVGLVGEGSDCFGYDDAFSRDHDWGPGFCMWVSDEVYAEIGEKLQEAYDGLPLEYKGYVYQSSNWAGKRRGVQRIGDFFRILLGVENCPKDGVEWNAENIRWENISEERLAAAVNGAVFQDEAGEFRRIRNLLESGYPARLRYLKLAEAAAKFAQSGQYNYERMSKRGDKAIAQLLAAEAAKEAMKLLYYVAEEYPPHDKWLLQGLRGRQEFAEAVAFIENLLTGTMDKKADYLEELGVQLAHILYQAGYISDVGSFLQEHVNELLFKASVAELSVEELAEKIARTEFTAFDKVKNQGGRAGCQDDWFTFSIMRKSQYLTWTKEMLLQYLYDFTREYERGHNLIEEKYGRMMESTALEEYEKMKEHFPVLSAEKKAIIEEIVRIQVRWMEEFAAEYPKLAGNARSIHTYEDHRFNTSYETYLRGELGTYSDKMLQLYGSYIVEYAGEGGNPAKDIMEHSVLMYGYEGLEEAEAGL